MAWTRFFFNVRERSRSRSHDLEFGTRHAAIPRCIHIPSLVHVGVVVIYGPDKGFSSMYVKGQGEGQMTLNLVRDMPP
ncbi:hypothetical protein ACXWO4_09935, partial [Streptococcus pyogenes]